jgi:hypothetical protein
LTAESGCGKKISELMNPLDGGHHLKYVDQRWAWLGKLNQAEIALLARVP